MDCLSSLSILMMCWLRALTTPLINNIFVKCSPPAREWPHYQPTEVHLRPGGGEVFGTSSFGLRDSPAPWPLGGGHPVSTPVVAPQTSTFPWTCQLLLMVFARCCQLSAPSDRRTSGFWQVPVLVPADGAGLQRRPGRCCRAQAPSGQLPHQLDGQRVRHSRHVGTVLKHFRHLS